MSSKNSKEYKIISSFHYRGKDGTEKDSVIIGPGEDVPKLNNDLIKQLLIQQKIAEVSQVDGTIIKYKKLEELSDDEIKKFLSRPVNFIRSQLKARYFSNDTLSRVFSAAEKMKLAPAVLSVIEEKIDGTL